MLDEQIKNLQTKPYRTRVKLLWLAVIVTLIVILMIWFVSLKFRQSSSSDSQPSKLGDLVHTIKDNFQKLKPR